MAEQTLSHYYRNFEGCNHHLSKRACALAERMSTRFGNALFDPRVEYPGFEKETSQLEEQGFLVLKRDTLYFRSKIIIGKGR